MKIFVRGLAEPHLFAERIVPSLLVDIAGALGVSDTGVVELLPDPDTLLSSKADQEWLRGVILETLKQYEQPVEGVNVEFCA